MPDPPEVFRDRYVSTDLAEVEQFLCDTYTELSLYLRGERDGFHFRHETLAVGDLAMSNLTSTVAVGAQVTPLGRIVVSDLHHGELTSTTGRHGDVRSVGGEVALIPLAEDFGSLMEPSALDVVVLDPARVADYAGHVCGIDPDGLDFTGLLPLSERMAHHWRSTVAHVRDDVLTDPELARDPLVVDSAFRSLAAGLLCTFPNTALAAATDPEARGALGDVGEGTLREVVDYLHTHAGDAIGPADIAGLADEPYREVLEGLRRRGLHPAELLWAARIDGARRDLAAASPETGSVGAVATRWGFSSRRAFVLAYTRATGGETPEDTLRR